MLISSSLRPSLSQEVPRYPSMFMINSKLITFSYTFSHVSHKKVLDGTSANFGGFGRHFGLENLEINFAYLLGIFLLEKSCVRSCHCIKLFIPNETQYLMVHLWLGMEEQATMKRSILGGNKHLLKIFMYQFFCQLNNQ